MSTPLSSAHIAVNTAIARAAASSGTRKDEMRLANELNVEGDRCREGGNM